MILLGLDLSTSTARAVLVDERGEQLAFASDPDYAAAVRSVLDGRSADAAGVAVQDAAAGGVSLAGIANAPSPHVVLHGGAVALGEQWTGAARDARYAVALSAADSIDAGIVVDGRLFGGAHGFAGAIRWLALNPVEREDYRKLGCLEAEVGSPGIVRRLVWRIKAGDSSQALDLAGGNLAAVGLSHVFEAARGGDGVAISVVRDTAKYIGMAIANLVSILDPEIVVLGGAIADAGDLLLEPARLELSRRVPPAVSRQVQVVAAGLGERAAAVGAARAAQLGTSR